MERSAVPLGCGVLDLSARSAREGKFASVQKPPICIFTPPGVLPPALRIPPGRDQKVLVAHYHVGHSGPARLMASTELTGFRWQAGWSGRALAWLSGQLALVCLDGYSEYWLSFVTSLGTRHEHVLRCTGGPGWILWALVRLADPCSRRPARPPQRARREQLRKKNSRTGQQQSGRNAGRRNGRKIVGRSGPSRAPRDENE